LPIASLLVGELGAPAERLRGRAGNDELYGGDGNDWLEGESGDDSFAHGNGDDFLEGGAGADALDGGAGTDVASYAAAAGAVRVDLAAGTGTLGAVSRAQRSTKRKRSDALQTRDPGRCRRAGRNRSPASAAHHGACASCCAACGRRATEEHHPGWRGRDTLDGNRGNDRVRRKDCDRRKMPCVSPAQRSTERKRSDALRTRDPVAVCTREETEVSHLRRTTALALRAAPLGDTGPPLLPPRASRASPSFRALPASAQFRVRKRSSGGHGLPCAALGAPACRRVDRDRPEPQRRLASAWVSRAGAAGPGDSTQDHCHFGMVNTPP
jgi:hypothetical protein